jgi:hypothetical protein
VVSVAVAVAVGVSAGLGAVASVGVPDAVVGDASDPGAVADGVVGAGAGVDAVPDGAVEAVSDGVEEALAEVSGGVSACAREAASRRVIMAGVSA